MTLKYFEGFDIHRQVITGGLIVSDTDSWRNWRSGTLGYWRPEFLQGYRYGGALRTGETLYAAKEASPKGQSTFRMGFWGKGAIAPQSLKVAYWFLYVRFEDGGRVGLRANLDGSLVPVQDSYLNPIGDATGENQLDEYQYYEIFVDPSAGVFRVWINKVLVIDATGMIPTSALVSSFSWGSLTGGLPFPYWNPVVDHLWMTDGAELKETDMGVAVVAAQDSYISGGRGFRGTIMLNGERYQTEWLASSTFSPGQGGRNVIDVTPFYFMKDPRTGNDWTPETIEDISFWGVCFAPTDAVPGNYARIDSVVLSYMDWNSGMPLVRYEIAGTVAQYSGNWVKTDPDKTYAAHVNDVPRDDILMRADSLSLYTDTVGCILFDRPSSPGARTDPDDVDYPIQSFGVTFAEEYREDYRDFVKADGQGTDYLSYAVSGYGVYGEGNRQFQGNYITVNYAPLSNGQAYVQGVWDYSIDKATGRWSMRQQVYFLDDDGHKHFARKVKIRGHGKALQIRIESQSGKAFEINGWTLYVTANQHP